MCSSMRSRSATAFGSDDLFGGDGQAVRVALDGVEQLAGWILEFTELRCGRRLGLVAGEDLLERLGRRTGRDRFGTDDAVLVAVADGLEVEVVGVPAAGEHRVKLLPGFLAGEKSVHGVGGDALSAVNGGGVAEAGRLTDVVGGEPSGELAAGVSDA